MINSFGGRKHSPIAYILYGKVYFLTLNYHVCLIFTLELQNQIVYTIQLLKSDILPF